jgi:hypothetical protein
MRGQPVEPQLAIFATRLSYRLAAIVLPCLREEEFQVLVAEYYQAIVEDTQQFQEQRRKRA